MQRIIRLDLDGVNSYLIENGGNYILVDTGGHMFADRAYHDHLDLLMEKLNQNGVTKNNLKLLLLTHGDIDHVNNAAYIKKEYEVQVAIGEEDAYMLSHPQWDCYKENLKFSSKIMGLAMKMLNKKIERLMQKIYGEFICVNPDILLKEGMDLEEFGFHGTIYSTPGHTKGSICILDEEGNLLCGDMFANNKKPDLALNAADFAVLKEQTGRIVKLPIKVIYPGHGEPFSKADFKIRG